MKHLERALDRQNHWGKYVLTFILAWVGAGIGSIPLISALRGQGNILDFSAAGIPAHVGLSLMLLPFISGLVTMALFIKLFHKRTLKETINGRNTIRWSRFFVGAAGWGLVGVICILLDYGLHPGNFQFSFNAGSFFPLLLVSIALIPLQAAFEEILCRGYLAQGIAASMRSRWLVLIIPALLFALMHYSNPEVVEYGFWTAMPSYLFIALLLGLVTILDDGLEIAMGMHAINNIIGAILITNKSSVFQTPALLTELRVDPVKDLIIEVVAGLLFLAVLSRRYKWNYGILNKKVKAPEEKFRLDDPIALTPAPPEI